MADKAASLTGSHSICIQPAVDRSFSHHPNVQKARKGKEKHQQADLLPPAMGQWGCAAWLGYGIHPPELLESRYASPANLTVLKTDAAWIKKWPSTFMSFG